MRTSTLAAAAGLLTLTACSAPTFTAQAAYAQLAIDGDLGYVDASTPSGANISQDVESAFGLGDDQGSPFVRAMLDTGLLVFAASGFMLEDSGEGVLEADFGDGALVAGAPVASELEFANAKGSVAFEIPIGPISISPGLAANYVDLDLQVRDLIGVTTERLELNAPLPMLLLRAQADFKWISALAEVGYVTADVEDVDATLIDIEAMLMFHPTPLLNLFVGYRAMALDAEGTVDDDTFDTDLEISGFLIGGGVRF